MAGRHNNGDLLDQLHERISLLTEELCLFTEELRQFAEEENLVSSFDSEPEQLRRHIDLRYRLVQLNERTRLFEEEVIIIRGEYDILVHDSSEDESGSEDEIRGSESYYEHYNDIKDGIEGESNIKRSSTKIANPEIELGGDQHQVSGMSDEGDGIQETPVLPECPVCKESLEIKEIVATKCGHLTCVDCMQTILSGRYTRACPKCRTRIEHNTVRYIHP